MQICRQYAAKDSRIRVFSLDEKGVSIARNYGISMAKAKFVGFVDGDDWAEPDMFEAMYSAASRLNADGAYCQYVKEYEDGHADAPSSHISEEVIKVSGMWLQKELLWQRALSGPCAYMVKRDILRVHPFPVGRFFEDYASIYLWAALTESFAVISRPLYHYFTRAGSTMQSYLDSYPLCCDYALAEIERLEYVIKERNEVTIDEALISHTLLMAMERFNMMMRVSGKYRPDHIMASYRKRLLRSLRKVRVAGLLAKTLLHVALLRFLWPMSLWLITLRRQCLLR